MSRSSSPQRSAPARCAGRLPRRQAQRRAAVLEAWFAAHQRDLPWRREARSEAQRAYRCLVAEYMLHQTQVKRVIGYFDRFMARFPNVRALAAAPERDVLAHWQGLGYYRRARNLHEAARTIVREHRGRVPADVAGLLALPGVGRYTAGAIASIAYGAKAPIVDGNVQRVLCRWFELGPPLSRGELEREVWRLAETLVNASTDAGAFNQALMELGSTVCLPRGARCAECPAAAWCRARKYDTVDRYPLTRERGETPVIHAASLVVERRGRILLAPRPARGLWAGMWQCPTLESPDHIDAAALSAFVVREFGLAADLGEPVARFTHQTSHRRLEFSIWRAAACRGRVRRAQWVSHADLDGFPLSSAQKRVLASANGSVESPGPGRRGRGGGASEGAATSAASPRRSRRRN